MEDGRGGHSHGENHAHRPRDSAGSSRVRGGGGGLNSKTCKQAVAAGRTLGG